MRDLYSRVMFKIYVYGLNMSDKRDYNFPSGNGSLKNDIKHKMQGMKK